jgi:peptidoglycan hydrolase FlgJ
MDYSTSISTSYADTYDKTSSQLSDKLASTDFSQASDDELMSVCKDFESYFVEQMLKSMQKKFFKSIK